MNTRLNLCALGALLLVGAGVVGCSSISSTGKRAGLIALGTGAGGAGGYLIGDKNPTKTVVGAMTGAALTNLALGEDTEVRQEGFDEGYVHGQSDAIKRQYFLRHALEAEPLGGTKTAGEPVYYVMPGPEVTAYGRKLEPHTVAVRVIE